MKTRIVVLASLLIIGLLVVGRISLTNGTGKFGLYSNTDFLEGILVEAHGMILDTLVIGLIILMITSYYEKKREIAALHEKIDLYRPLKTLDAKQNILNCLRKLNSNKKYVADLHQCDLSDTIITNINLTGSSIHALNLSHSNLKNSILKGLKAQRSILNDANITNTNLSGSDIYRGEMNRMKARSANFFNCKIIRTNFNQSDLNNSDFRMCTLDKVSFEKAILSNVDFRNCTFLTNISFLDANLNSSKFTSSKGIIPSEIIKANSAKNAKFDPEVIIEINRLRPGFV